jgi:hypothetical protein
MVRKARLVCRLLLPAGLLLVGLASATAQGTPEQRQACAPDAMRLCSDFIPDVPKITKCMLAKRSQLSEACRLTMSHGHKGHGHYRHKAKATCVGWGCA